MLGGYILNDNEMIDDLFLRVKGKNYKPYIFVIFTILSTLIKVLSSAGTNTDSAIFTIYFDIILVLASIYFIGFWAILGVCVSSFFFVISIKQTIPNMIINVAANTVQALVIFTSSKLVRLEKKYDYVSLPKMLMVLLGIVYVVLAIIVQEYYIYFASIIAGLLFLLGIIDFIGKNDKNILLYLLLICLLPNLIGSLIGALDYNNEYIFGAYFNRASKWFLSNFVFLTSVGYPIYDCISKKEVKNNSNGVLEFRLSAVLFYGALLLWNIIIYVLFFLGWLNKNMATYVFPWFVGNMFFIFNLLVSMKKENDDADVNELFKWYESRSIVAENNTQMLVAIISFLFPICAQVLGTITNSVALLFVLNITSAVITIGLIWIPKNNIRYMSILKNVKTVFHLLTLSLLLLNIVLIINESI